MIGYRTIEDFTFDDCRVYLAEHEGSDLSCGEVNQRYQQLLSQLKRDDERAFRGCKTTHDYRNYLSRFKNMSGASCYVPIHKNEAEAFIRKNPTPVPPPNIGFFASYIYDARKRNPVTNIVLYLLLLASFVTAICLLPMVIDSNQDLFDQGRSFVKVYGKVFLPGFLFCIIAFVGISMIIKWKRLGITIMAVSSVIIMFPTIYNEFLEFLFFSGSFIMGTFLLWCVLKLKKNGISTWKRCKPEPRWADYLLRIVLVIWLFVVVLLPPIVSFANGFRENLYNNGMRCLDAYFNDSPFYSYDVYQRILLGHDFADDSDRKIKSAEVWLERARNLNKICDDNEELSYGYVEEFSEAVLFLNNLIFTLNNESEQKALVYIDQMKNTIDMSAVFQYINGERSIMGDYEYYEPNRERITSILRQAGIFDECVIEVAEEEIQPAEEAYVEEAME